MATKKKSKMPSSKGSRSASKVPWKTLEVITQGYLARLCGGDRKCHFGYSMQPDCIMISVGFEEQGIFHLDLKSGCVEWPLSSESYPLPHSEWEILKRHQRRFSMFSRVRVQRCDEGVCEYEGECGISNYFESVLQRTKVWINSERGELQLVDPGHHRVKGSKSIGHIWWEVDCSKRTKNRHLPSGETKTSEGEKAVRTWLEEQGLIEIDRGLVDSPTQSFTKPCFTREQTFSGLVDKRELKVDFWVPPGTMPWASEVGLAIEFDGNYPGSHGVPDENGETGLRRDLVKDTFFASQRMIRVPWIHRSHVSEYLDLTIRQYDKPTAVKIE